MIPVGGLGAPLLVVVHPQSGAEADEIAAVSGRGGGRRVGHRDLVAHGGPIRTRQSVRDQHHVAHSGVVHHPWMKDSSDPVLPRPGNGRQFDGAALRDAEPAGRNLAQADLPVPQARPELVT